MGVIDSTACDVCDDTGTWHMDPWGYVYGGWSGGKGHTAHACYDCHRARRWRDDHIDTIAFLIDCEDDEAGAAVDSWFESNGDLTVIEFAAALKAREQTAQLAT